LDKKKKIHTSLPKNPRLPHPFASLGEEVPPRSADFVGCLDKNSTADKASWADLYLGEEIANRDVVDVSRLQKLVMTILLLMVYIHYLWVQVGSAPTAGFTQMPKVGQSFLYLLGISHAAYLAYKATPKSL